VDSVLVCCHLRDGSSDVCPSGRHGTLRGSGNRSSIRRGGSPTLPG
jgi:hypothetical protein